MPKKTTRTTTTRARRATTTTPPADAPTPAADPATTDVHEPRAASRSRHAPATTEPMTTEGGRSRYLEPSVFQELIEARVAALEARLAQLTDDE